MRILSQTLQKQNEAVQSAKRSFEEATVRYKAGVDPYLNVLIAQTIFLNDQQAAVNFRTQQMVASVQLIKALGGGWNNSRIPAPGDLPREISAGQPR